MNIERTNIAEFIQSSWKKSINEMFPEQGEKYPGRLIAFHEVEIGGQKKMFRIQIQESSIPSIETLRSFGLDFITEKSIPE